MPRLSRQEAKERTRAELLAAAARVFAARGYEGARVQEIADAAGRTTGAIYAHFPTKEALFLALLGERYSRRAPYRRDNIPADGAAVVDYVADWFATDSSDDHWNLLMLEFALFSIRHPDRTVEYRDRVARGRDVLASTLAGLLESSGRRPPLEPALLASLVFALQEGLRLQLQAEADLPVRDLYAYALRRIMAPEPPSN